MWALLQGLLWPFPDIWQPSHKRRISEIRRLQQSSLDFQLTQYVVPLVFVLLRVSIHATLMISGCHLL